MPTRRFSGGLIHLNHGQPYSLQYFVNVAFLAYLFASYMKDIGVLGWFCGHNCFQISYYSLHFICYSTRL